MNVTTRFDFDKVVDRSNTNSLKWGAARDLLSVEQCKATPLPMWVADMDFKSPQPIIDALHEEVSRGVFGYPAGLTNSYLAAVAGWQARRFGWHIQKDWIVPVASVVAALKTLIQAFTKPGDSVLIQPPVYAHFRDDVIVNGRLVAAAPLEFDGERYRFDPRSFEDAIRADTKLFILSNPHNPTGNVWTADELCTMGEICCRRGVLIVADEIHCDFVLPAGKSHIPFASLGERLAQNSITCTSASKTFNLAGLQCGSMFVPDKAKRDEVRRTIERNYNSRVNMLGMVATEAAYTHCEEWVDALVAYVAANQRQFAAAVSDQVRGLKVIPMDSLYLAWIDCRELGLSPTDLEDFLLTKARVWFDKGSKFGVEGNGFMRANLGCSRKTLDEAIGRLSSALPKL
ncbi:pyridoxal phosphate-dependent aminotransferase [Bradyrhizobium liaoningense]|nr:pyridoxal phosphate-dependent aminotransferase [Bradyrhizobium liaoningense]